MNKWAWTAVGIFIASCFWGFWSYGPFDLDEGLYAVAAMEMKEHGDWIVPTYRGVPFFEKPILFYWTARVAEMAGVPGVSALRLPSILATIGTLILVGLFTRRIGGVMILSVSVLLMGVGRMFMPDPFLIFGMTAALFAFWKSGKDPRWHVAAGIALAIAVLAKGPMPLVVFGLLGIYCRFRFDRPVADSAMVSGWKVLGGLTFLVLALPWYVLAAMRSPVFVEEFLLKQNLGRLAGADVVHAGPIWMYIPVILVGMLPFSFSLFGAWRKREGALEQYLWAFIWIVFALFSVAGTKLPHYILPIFPALAILVDRYHAKSPGRAFLVYPATALAIAIILMFYGLFADRENALASTAAWVGSIALIIGGCVALLMARRGRSTPGAIGFASVAPMALATLIFAPPWYWQATHLDPILAAKAAHAQGLPIIEYRTGGERERGKTSHPSIQWTIGQNTRATESYSDLKHFVEEGPITVIARGGRLKADQMRHSSVLGSVKSVAIHGDFEVYVIAPIK